MPLDPQAIYVQLGRLVEQMPKFDDGLPTSEVRIWLGRLHALLQEMNCLADIVGLSNASQGLASHATRYRAMNDIQMIAFRALAVAELKAPSSSQGAFIPAGNTFDAMAAVGKVLAPAKSDVLIIDPYMDEKALTDFAVLVPVGVGIRLLADREYCKAALVPAVQRWTAQHQTQRPLEAKLTPKRTLHDRLIIVDDQTVWVLTQSLNAFAARSPATIVRSDGDAATLKVDAYRAMWATASTI